ncbi:response regulator [Pseudomonas aeruginosa]|uniref:response regulator n=1 Tax=Pseudomonas aeruginosa TaxID=287 RepID=UPI003F2CF32D
MKKLNVVVADDHSIVLLGVREVLEKDPGFQLVGEASCSSELIRMVGEVRPDILITDYCMPGDSQYGDGVKLIEYVCRNFPRTRVLIFTMMSNPLILSKLYDVGVAGVVLKSGARNELLTALSTLRRGRVYRCSSPPSTHSVLSIDDELMARVATLSIKELEVLRDFVMGLNLREIALKRNRSIKTISAQKISAMRKLNAENDQMLMTYCIQARMFE